MTLEELRELLGRRPFLLEIGQDYKVENGQIVNLGIYDEMIKFLRAKVSSEWKFEEVRRNVENGFVRINIVKG